MYTRRAWYLLSREDDVIEIGTEFIEQKSKVLCIIQPPTLSLMVSVYDIHPPVATSRYMAAMVALFPVLSLWVRPCKIKVSVTPL